MASSTRELAARSGPARLRHPARHRRRTRHVWGPSLLLVLVLAAVALLVVRSNALGRDAPAVGGVTRTVVPGQSLVAALQASAPGDVVVLRDGRYPRQRLDGLALPGVVLRGESREAVVVAGLSLEHVSGLTVSDMTVTNEPDSSQSAIHVSSSSRDLLFRHLTVAPQVFSGLDIWATTKRIALRDSTLDGSGVTGTRATDGTSRGVRVNGQPYDDLSGWPTDIVIAGNDISGFGSDLVQIGGGTRVLVQDNDLHDPQANDDHNDGVQTYGSADLRIEGNRFSSSGPNGPDQAVMLQDQGQVASLTVVRTTVVDNLVTSWRGTGINIAGTDGTTVSRNTVARTGNADSPGSSIAISGSNPGLEIGRNVLDRIYATGAPGDQHDNCVREGGSGPGLVTEDPGFADDASLRLRASSPCHGRGRS